MPTEHQPDDAKEQTRRLWREVAMESMKRVTPEYAVQIADTITAAYKRRIESGEL